MKKIIITIICALFVVNVNAQLLYKIKGKGMDKPSYIVGTYHLAPASFVESIPGANNVLASVEQVCGELDMKEMESPESMQKMMEAMLLPEGQILADVLTVEEMDKLNAGLRQILGVDLTNPMIAEQMGKMTPMSLITTLEVVVCMMETPGFNPSALIDSYFQQEALKKGKDVIGFETVDFQIETLYKNTSFERQKEQLFCFFDNMEEYSKSRKEIIENYYSQNIDNLLEAMNEETGTTCDSTEEKIDALINDRNADWVNKMPAIMNEKSTLFVVGAGHLPGEKGVLELLKQNGYKVKAVKK